MQRLHAEKVAYETNLEKRLANFVTKESYYSL